MKMKITKSKLKQIIKEELKLILESWTYGRGPGPEWPDDYVFSGGTFEFKNPGGAPNKTTIEITSQDPGKRVSHGIELTWDPVPFVDLKLNGVELPEVIPTPDGIESLILGITRELVKLDVQKYWFLEAPDEAESASKFEEELRKILAPENYTEPQFRRRR